MSCDLCFCGPWLVSNVGSLSVSVCVSTSWFGWRCWFRLRLLSFAFSLWNIRVKAGGSKISGICSSSAFCQSNGTPNMSKHIRFHSISYLQRFGFFFFLARFSRSDSRHFSFSAERNWIEKVHSIKQSIRLWNFKWDDQIRQAYEMTRSPTQQRYSWLSFQKLYQCWPCTSEKANEQLNGANHTIHNQSTKQSNRKNWKMSTLFNHNHNHNHMFSFISYEIVKQYLFWMIQYDCENMHINKYVTKESVALRVDDDDNDDGDGNRWMTIVNDEHDRQYNMFIYQMNADEKWNMFWAWCFYWFFLYNFSVCVFA